ncbi:MAG TPA: hypothetical protein VF070_45825 [Streptosporangiaceae bacterium]
MDNLLGRGGELRGLGSAHDNPRQIDVPPGQHGWTGGEEPATFTRQIGRRRY